MDTDFSNKGNNGSASGICGLRSLLKRFVWLLVQEYRQYNLLNMASSLSYNTLLALVPVFAIILGVVGSVQDGMYTEMFITTLKNQIPAVTGMDNLIDAIREIAGSARAIVGVGLVMFVGAGFFLFLTVVKDFNRIWRVDKARSIMVRMSGFITAVVLVPLLMILSIYANLYVARTVDTLETAVARRSVAETSQDYDQATRFSSSKTGSQGRGGLEETPDVSDKADDPLISSRDRLIYDSKNPDKVSKEVEDYRSGKAPVKIALRLTSLLLGILAMSAIYFFLPNRRVKWWAALSGGVIAGIILEMSNFLFRIYAGMASTVLLKIYGTLLAIPLGLLWLWILWVIVLMGAVVGFVVQHFHELSDQEELKNRSVDNDLFIALLLTADTAERFSQGGSTSDMVDDISAQTGFSAVLVRAILSKLLEKGVLASVEGQEGEYVPGRSISSLTLDQIVFPILGDVFSIPQGVDSYKSRKIIQILENAGFALRNSLEQTTLAELAVSEEDPEPETD
jgi:uncharacterized BrkB/YihY/UPF0761 family membrane protein/DNA-binding IscR family transcriptional regulator